MNEGRYVRIPLAVLGRADLNATEKLVYALIADRIGQNGVCWPSVSRIAADGGMSRMTVMRATANLVKAGLISIDRATGKGNQYRLATGHTLQPVSNCDQSK